MTKADLVEEVTQLGDLTRRDGEMIVDTIFDSVIHALRTGDKIEIRGFGSFRIRQRKPRTGRNPKTGAKVDVPAKRVPYFKPSKELRDLVNPKETGAGGSQVKRQWGRTFGRLRLPTRAGKGDADHAHHPSGKSPFDAVREEAIRVATGALPGQERCIS